MIDVTPVRIRTAVKGSQKCGPFYMHQQEGGLMANEENLKKGKATQFRSGEEAAKNGKKGGQASGKSRREKKAFRERLEILMQLPVEQGDRLNLDDVKSLSDFDDANALATDIIAVQLMSRAMGGDLNAIKLALSITGQLTPPPEQPAVTDDGFLDALAGTAAEDWSDGNEEA